jgi:nucleoid DNA-binding protein
MFPFRMTDKRGLEMVIMGKKGLNKKANRIIRTFTRDDLLNMISNETGVSQNFARSIYDTMEEKIRFMLSQANEREDVKLKLFEGIALECKFIPEKVWKNNLTGEIITAKSKRKIKGKVTKNYCDKLY